VPQRVEGSIEIQRPVDEVYDYWETLENLSQFMKNVEEVRTTGPDTTHWTIKGPFGATVEFDARTTEKQSNSAIGWNTIEGEVGTSGEVRFSDVGSGSTRVDVIMNYANPPGGKLGEKVSRIVADPQLILAQDLENLRDVLEGEATPEDIQQRPAAANVQSGVIVFLTSGVGLTLLGSFVVVLILRSILRSRKTGSSGGGAGGSGSGEEDPERKFRFIIEF
jgi:uncharacterized membrane protein